MFLQLQTLAIIAILASSAIAQKYQYSLGWTNGAEGEKTRKIYDECRIMKTEAILGLKPLSPRYFSECIKNGETKNDLDLPYFTEQNRFLFTGV